MGFYVQALSTQLRDFGGKQEDCGNRVVTVFNDAVLIVNKRLPLHNGTSI